MVAQILIPNNLLFIMYFSDLTEKSILLNLRIRYQANLIYVSIFPKNNCAFWTLVMMWVN